MHRLLALWVIFGALALVPGARGQTNVLAQINRTIRKEPAYQTAPKYCLLALGSNATVPVWMVEDGKRLFVDQNANGDLTDDGPPIPQSDVRSLGALKPGVDRWDCNYVLAAITPAAGPRHTHFDLRRWNYGDPEDQYGLSLSVGDLLPVYAGWFGSFWSTNAATAPIVHCGGAFTPKMLRTKEFVIGPGKRRLSIGFMNPGLGAGAESRLSIEALPKFLTPKLNIEWPTAPGHAPVRTSHLLTERCCYWEFYTTTFEMPDHVTVGTAKVTVDFPDSLVPIQLATTKFQAPVVTAGKESK